MNTQPASWPTPNVYSTGFHIDDVLIDEEGGQLYVLYSHRETDTDYVVSWPWLGGAVGAESTIIERQRGSLLYGPLSLNRATQTLAIGPTIHDLNANTSFRLPTHRSPSFYSPMGHWYIMIFDGENGDALRLYDDTMTVVKDITPETFFSMGEFSPDETMLSVINYDSGYVVQSLSVPDLRALAEIPVGEAANDKALYTTFSPDSRQLVTVYGPDITFTSLKDKTQRTFKAPVRSLFRGVFDSTGRWFATIQMSLHSGEAIGVYVFDLSAWQSSDAPPFYFLPTEGQTIDIQFVKEGLVVTESLRRVSLWTWENMTGTTTIPLITLDDLGNALK
jgi:hypothetical protein